MMYEKVTIGNCELWHGDCREVLPLLKFDAVITDPPYGFEFDGAVGYSAGSMSDARLLHDGNAFKTKGFCELPVFRGMTLEQKNNLILLHRERVSLCGGELIIDFAAPKTSHLLARAAELEGYEISDLGVWKYSSGMRKRRTLWQPQHEPFLVLYGGGMRMDCGGRGGNIIDVEKPRNKVGHPTQKPISLMGELVRGVPSS